MGYESTKRWRHENLELHREEMRRYRRRTGSGSAPARGQPWKKHEDLQVLAMTVVDSKLAASLGRSVHAIRLRRSRLRKLAREATPCSPAFVSSSTDRTPTTPPPLIPTELWVAVWTAVAAGLP